MACISLNSVFKRVKNCQELKQHRFWTGFIPSWDNNLFFSWLIMPANLLFSSLAEPLFLREELKCADWDVCI